MLHITLDINPSSDIYLASVLPHSVGCPYALLTVSFPVQKLLRLIRSHWFHFCFCFPCLSVCLFNHSVVSNSLWPCGLYPTRCLCPWDSPGKNTGVGRYSLLQGVFPTQGSILSLLHCRQILYYLSHQGSYQALRQKPNMWSSGDTKAGVQDICFCLSL